MGLEERLDWLLECRAEIGHPDPELAVRIVLHMLVHAVQIPFVYALPCPDEGGVESFKRELLRMALMYLGQTERQSDGG